MPLVKRQELKKPNLTLVETALKMLRQPEVGVAVVILALAERAGRVILSEARGQGLGAVVEAREQIPVQVLRMAEQVQMVAFI
jgi:hypothetical protein